MPATATRKSKEAGRPAARLIPAKAPAKSAAQRKAPARTPKDWREEEANEGEARSMRGANGGQPLTAEQIVIGDNYSIGNWGHPDWQDEDGNRLTVSFWFPTQRAAIDYPDDETELSIKTAVFKKLKVPYVGVLPGQPLRVEEARKQLLAQGAKIAR